MPWSLAYPVFDDSTRSQPSASIIVAALSNLVLHAWFVYLLHRAAKVEAANAQ